MANKSILYLGLCMKDFPRKDMAKHYPVIKISERKDIQAHVYNLESYTHIIFTSKTSVDLFFKYIKTVSQTCIAIGPSTAQRLKIYGIDANYPEKFTQEGLIAFLNQISLEKCSFFLPRSSIARKKIDQFFQSRQVHYTVCPLYDTIAQVPKPIPNLSEYRELIFTSPSTVRAFFKIFEKIPEHIHCTCIGPITEKILLQRLS